MYTIGEWEIQGAIRNSGESTTRVSPNTYEYEWARDLLDPQANEDTATGHGGIPSNSGVE